MGLSRLGKKWRSQIDPPIKYNDNLASVKQPNGQNSPNKHNSYTTVGCSFGISGRWFFPVLLSNERRAAGRRWGHNDSFLFTRQEEKQEARGRESAGRADGPILPRLLQFYARVPGETIHPLPAANPEETIRWLYAMALEEAACLSVFERGKSLFSFLEWRAGRRRFWPSGGSLLRWANPATRPAWPCSGCAGQWRNRRESSIEQAW